MPEKSGSSKGSLARPAADKRAPPPDGGGGCGVCLVYTTFPSLESAKTAARHLIESRLAACVNIVPGMVAIYRWEGRLHEDNEVSVLIKTRRALGEACMAAIRAGHPYTNPAALAFEPYAGSQDYIDWILENTQPAPP